LPPDSFTAVLNMKGIKSQGTALAQENVREVAAANDVERSSLLGTRNHERFRT
jgi:hypothetical protein